MVSFSASFYSWFFDWFSGSFSLTRIAGLAAYSMSLAVCAVAWLRTKTRHRQNQAQVHLFALLTMLQLALVLDMVVNGRWLFHEFWMRKAMAQGVYEMRRAPQLIALVLLACALFASILLAFRHYLLRQSVPRRGAALALTGTFLSLAIWCAEALSYHGLDALLYRQVLPSAGGMMSVSFFWIPCALATSVGVLLEYRQCRREGNWS